MERKKKIYLLLSGVLVLGIIVLGLGLSKNSYALSDTNVEIDDSTLNDYQRAIINTAQAYYDRGKYLQYTDKALTYGSSEYKSARSECGFAPEEASSYRTKYASCSPFVWNIYYDAFVDQANNHYMIGYYVDNTFIPTSNSMHFIYLSNPYKTTPESDDDYFYSADRNIAVYNISLKVNDSTSLNKSFYESINDDSVKIYENVMGEAESEYTYPTAGDYEARADAFVEYVIGRLRSVLQPGDMIGYASGYDGTSHALIYLGLDDETIYHSWTGGNYDYTGKYDSIGSTGTSTKWTLSGASSSLENELKSVEHKIAEAVENGTATRETKGLRQISVVRPLNEIIAKGYKISTSAQNREECPSLVRAKTVSAPEYTSVNLGSVLTYTISLNNKAASGTCSNVVVTDVIPDHTTFVSADNSYSLSGNTLSWNVDVPAGDKVEITYKVKVDTDTSLLGTKIVSDQAVAGGIKLNKTETMIENSLTVEEREVFADKATSMINSNKSSTSAFLNDVYSDYGVTFEDLDTIFNKFFIDTGETYESNGVYNIYNFNDNVLKHQGSLDATQKMYVDGLFGGRYTEVADYTLAYKRLACYTSDGRNKTYRDNTFMVGDILFLYDSAYGDDSKTDGVFLDDVVYRQKNAYVYVGNGEFLTIDNSGSSDGGKVVKVDSKIFRFNGIKKYVVGDTFSGTTYTYEIEGINGDCEGCTPCTNCVNYKRVSDGRQYTRDYYYRLIDSVLGQDAYVVLRPSFISNLDPLRAIGTEVDENNDIDEIIESKGNGVYNPKTGNDLYYMIIGLIIISVAAIILIKEKRLKNK